MKKLFSLGSSIDAGSGSTLREEFHRALANRKPRRPFNGGLSLILLGLATLPLFAQPGPVSVRPDCFQFFTFTATGNGLTFDNRSAGCPYFAIAYSSNGFSVESLVVQVAPDAGGTPGTWVTYTANSGINPNTAITQAFSTFSGYFPWVRVQLTSVTGSGSIQGVLYGWRTPADIIASGGSSGGCPGTAGTPCVVTGVDSTGSAPSPNNNPVVAGGFTTGAGSVRALLVNNAGTLSVSPGTLSGNSVQLAVDTNQAVIVSSANSNLVDGGANGVQILATPTGFPIYNLSYPFAFNGSTWDRQFVCSNQVFVNLAASGNAQVIAASGSTSIRVCHIHLSTSAPETIQLTTGTGVNCAGGNAVIDSYQNTSTLAMDFQPTAALRGGASNALCVNPSANTTLTGVIVYAQF